MHRTLPEQPREARASRGDAVTNATVVLKSIHLVRYRRINGEWNVPDEELVRFFRRAADEGLLSALQWRSDPALTNIYEAPRKLRSLNNPFFLVYAQDEPVGYFLLDDVRPEAARLHFCIFRWVHRAGLTVKVGRGVCRHLLMKRFDRQRDFLTLIAELPTFNKLACRYAERLGFRQLGEIPNFTRKYDDPTLHPMRYYYLQRSDVEFFDQNA